MKLRGTSLFPQEAVAVTSYNISAQQHAEGVTLLTVSFGTPATNAQIVAEASVILAELKLTGGKTCLVNGPASLPVAMAIAHGIGHLFGEVACYDPKLSAYVVCISHGGRQLGELISA